MGVPLFPVCAAYSTAGVWGTPTTVPCCRAPPGYLQCGSARSASTGCSALPPWGATSGRLSELGFRCKGPWNVESVGPRRSCLPQCQLYGQCAG